MQEIQTLLNSVYNSSDKTREQAIDALTEKLKESTKNTQRVQGEGSEL